MNIKIISINMFRPTFSWSKWACKTRDYHLTINDILNFESGKEYKILFLDRNWEDVCVWGGINRVDGKIYDPVEYFKDHYALYTHATHNIHNNEQCINGSIRWSFDLNNYEDWRFWEFDINFNKENWYPLRNNILPKNNGTFDSGIYEEEKHYTDFPLNTRLGWRGPAILWSDMDHLPLILHEN